MSVQGNEKDVPYEDHVIPNNDVGGAQGLSGMFDMVGEITKDAVGLVKEIGSDMAELGSEIADMMNHDLVGEEQFSNQEWADKEWAQLMERRALMLEQDHDIDR